MDFRSSTIQIFFRTTGLEQSIINVNKSPNIFYWRSIKEKKVSVVLGAKLGPILWKYKEIGIIKGFFSYFAWGIHLKVRDSGYRKNWMEIEGQNSKQQSLTKRLTNV